MVLSHKKWGVIVDRVYIGYVQGLHGLRGDLKIKCQFEEPDSALKVGNSIYLNEESHEITACKFYKGFYLVTIDNIKDINVVEHYKGYDIFIDRDALNLEKNYILNDLYGMTITSNGKKYGKVKEILSNGKYYILVSDAHNLMIPLINEYVINVDIESKTVACRDIEGLIL